MQLNHGQRKMKQCPAVLSASCQRAWQEQALTWKKELKHIVADAPTLQATQVEFLKLGEGLQPAAELPQRLVPRGGFTASRCETIGLHYILHYLDHVCMFWKAPLYVDVHKAAVRLQRCAQQLTGTLVAEHINSGRKVAQRRVIPQGTSDDRQCLDVEAIEAKSIIRSKNQGLHRGL
mgnify:CR=1 FL=1